MKHDAEYEKRCSESRRILSKYPDRVPVIVERNHRAKNTLPEIEKKKFLVPVCICLAFRLLLSGDNAMRRVQVYNI